MLRKCCKVVKVISIPKKSMAFGASFRAALDEAARGFLCKGRQAAGTAAPCVALGALGVLTAIPLNPAQAAVQVLQYSVTDTLTNFQVSPYYFPSPQFSVQPFSAALGTLTSAKIDWTSTGSFTGTTGSSGGSITFGLSGNYFVNGFAYPNNGGACGGGGGAGPNSSLSGTSCAATNSYLFQVSNAGTGYNSSILAAFIGGSNYTIAYKNTANQDDSPFPFTPVNIASGTATYVTSATVTYTYNPVVDAPGPLPLLGAGAAWGWSRRLRRRCGQRQG